MAETKHEERYGPYMTANNAPAPLVATASQNSWGSFRAFSESLDDDITFTGLSDDTQQWVQIQLDATIRIWAFRIACRTTVSAKDAGQVPKNFIVQGSIDGTIFEDIQIFTAIGWEQFTSWNADTNQYNWEDAKKIEIACTKEYQYYRISFGECQGISTQRNGAMTPTSSNTVKLTLIDLYMVEGEPDNPDPPGPPSTNELDAYLNTTDGMEVIVNNIKKDDDTITLDGVDWFMFNNTVTTSMYASGNHWIGIGENTEHLKACRRDGAMYYLYRQEGMLYNYYKFLKIRWEGYTYYSSTADSCALKYELFLFDTGDMFLNVIQAPTESSYIGTSNFTCGNNTIDLNIPVGSMPQITFYHKDVVGSMWEAAYEQINIRPPYDRKYLIADKLGNIYTVVNGERNVLEGVTDITGEVFRAHGVDEKPSGSLLLGLVKPRLMYWQDSLDAITALPATVTATPVTQTLYVQEQYMTNTFIKGVESVTVEATEGVLFAFAFNESLDWYMYGATGWHLAEDSEGMTGVDVQAIPAAQWESATAESKMYGIRIILKENETFTRFKMKYKN